MNLIVLKQTKENYQPDEQEIISYGEYLGLKFPQDQKFKLLLKQALKAPVPAGWQVCQTADDQHDIVFRNIKTQQIQQAHPLDQYYRAKIFRLKALTNNLHIQTILEQRQSWLKQSSELFRPSREEGVDYSLRDQQFINQIDEQQSMYDQDQQQQVQKKSQTQQLPKKKLIITTSKPSRAPRTYRKKPTINLEQIKQQLLNMHYTPNFTLQQIKQKSYPKFQTFQQNQQLKKIINLSQNIESKKQNLKKIQKQRKKKLQYLESLKNQLKFYQS